MCRLDLERSIFVLCLTIPALIAGCDRPAAKDKAAIDDNTPEARFERVMTSFRRKIEGQPVGFVVTQGTSRTMMSGTNKVTSQLIRPENAEGHYRAIVTVASESRYSVRHAEAEREKNTQNQNSSLLDDPKKKKGAAILEPDLQSGGRAPASTSATPDQPPEEVVARRPNEDTRKYELNYENDRWVLLTKPDPKTEQSIEFAFNEALARQ